MTSTTLKLDRTGKLRLSEADVTRQCIDWLRAEGWVCKRQHVGKFVALSAFRQYPAEPGIISIGETGDPDWLVMRPAGARASQRADVFYLEFKAPAGRLRPSQKLAHAALRSSGWLVCVAHGLDELRGWMTELGL